jgi:Domain of unknown function (DUF1906)
MIRSRSLSMRARFLLLVPAFLLSSFRSHPNQAPSQATEADASRTYLGFDANDYPGDESLAVLRKTFSFSGYWLNVPPGAKSNSWMGKRKALAKNGFGFLILFNGRLSKELRAPADAGALGEQDGELAAATAFKEGFVTGAGVVIFLDIEEGGRMLPEQLQYIDGWAAGVQRKGFLPGVYCSGIKVSEGKGQTITTAEDIHEHDPNIAAYFVYNDACPPSGGCVYTGKPPAPSRSGIEYARVWQFAQSPRRRNLTSRCAATYAADGNCYPATGGSLSRIELDLNSSVSPDPSNLGLHIIH